MRRFGHIPTIVGHRGSPRRAAENTLASLRRAVTEGASGVEVDLCRTRDGRVVLWHDPNPNSPRAIARQAGIADLFAVPDTPPLGSPLRRPVDELTLADMQKSHGYHRRRGVLAEFLGLGHGPRIPFETLEDLLAALPRIPALHHLYLDLKLPASLSREAFRLIARLTHFTSRDRGCAVTFHLLSPDADVIRVLLEATRDAPPSIVAYAHCTGPGVLARARELGTRHVSLGLHGRTWSAFLAELMKVLAARDRGELDRVAVWTFNDPRRLEQLFALGPDAVLTDDIPLAMRSLHAAHDHAPASEEVPGLPEPIGALATG